MAVGPTLVVLVAVPFAATTVPPPSTSTLAFALLSKHVLYKREKKEKRKIRVSRAANNYKESKGRIERCKLRYLRCQPSAARRWKRE